MPVVKNSKRRDIYTITPAELKAMLRVLKRAFDAKTLTDEDMTDLSHDPLDVYFDLMDADIEAVMVVTKD